MPLFLPLLSHFLLIIFFFSFPDSLQLAGSHDMDDFNTGGGRSELTEDALTTSSNRSLDFELLRGRETPIAPLFLERKRYFLEEDI